MEESVGGLIDQHLPKSGSSSDWDLQGLSEALLRDFNVSVDPKAWLAQEPELEEEALRAADRPGGQRRLPGAHGNRYGTEIMRHIEKEVMLKMLDQHWREHLAAMDYLRQGIHLRGYAQKDYRFEYKREAFELFAAMLDRVKFETVSFLVEDRDPYRGGDRARGGRAASASDACAAGTTCRGAVASSRPTARAPSRPCRKARWRASPAPSRAHHGRHRAADTRSIVGSAGNLCARRA